MPCVSSQGASPRAGLPAVCVFQGRDLLPDLQAAVGELQNQQLGPGLDPAQPLPGLLPTLREVHEGGEDPGQGLTGGGLQQAWLGSGLWSRSRNPTPAPAGQGGQYAFWASVSLSLKEDSGSGSFRPLFRSGLRHQDGYSEETVRWSVKCAMKR